MALYIDMSVAVRLLPNGPLAVRSWFDDQVAAGEVAFTSRLLRVELTRYLRRVNEPVGLRDVALDRIAVVALTENVLILAESIHAHTKALDAIHLATAVASGLAPVVVTHDTRMAEVATSLGLETHDPVPA